MSSHAESASSSSAEPYAWVNNLLAYYEREGFYQHHILPAPPRQPTRRVLKHRRSTYDYYSVDLPWQSEQDELEAQQYRDLMRNLTSRYGSGNVVAAHPTNEMIEARPEYGERPHRLIMVRPAENIPTNVENMPAVIEERSLLKSLVNRWRAA